jgi:hypothetical protein
LLQAGEPLTHQLHTRLKVLHGQTHVYNQNHAGDTCITSTEGCTLRWPRSSMKNRFWGLYQRHVSSDWTFAVQTARTCRRLASWRDPRWWLLGVKPGAVPVKPPQAHVLPRDTKAWQQPPAQQQLLWAAARLRRCCCLAAIKCSNCSCSSSSCSSSGPSDLPVHAYRHAQFVSRRQQITGIVCRVFCSQLAHRLHALIEHTAGTLLKSSYGQADAVAGTSRPRPCRHHVR